MEDPSVSLEPLCQESSDKRLWIGNLDIRINEYHLLKLVRAYGNIDKLDMLYHRSGPSAGQPRGFAFVTYKNRQDALMAMQSLNGQLVGSKKIAVKLAKATSDEAERSKLELGIPVLAAGSAGTESKISKKTAIQSIEAKLKLMENGDDAGAQLVINKLASAETPIIAQYQTNKATSNSKPNYYKRRHPYHRR